MNRIEELTFRLLDGGLAPHEQEELDRLLATDEAVRRHVALLELEAALLATGPAPDVAGTAVERVGAIQTDDLERSVMRTLGALPPPPPAPGLARRRLRTPALFLVAAAALFLIVLLTRPGESPPGTGEPGKAPAPFLLDRSPDVLVESEGGERVTPSVGAPLQPGRTLRTGQGGHATLSYADGTRLELSAGAVLSLEAARSGKRVRLQAGGLRASVPEQANDLPLAVVTSQAEFLGAGGTFQVIVLGGHGTRIDLEDGKAELIRAGQPAISLAPRTSAFVPNEGEPVFPPRQAPGLQLRRELAFPNLRSLSFSPDGKTVLATTRWQAVYWHESDQIEAVPVSPHGRKRIDVEALTGWALVATERQENRLRIWDALKRETRRLVAPRPAGRLVAVSPGGDWLAFATGGNRQLVLLDTATGNPIRVTVEQKVFGFAASPDGLLAVARRNSAREAPLAVDLVEAATGRVTGSLPVTGTAGVTLAFSADGRRLAVGTHGKVQVWDVAARRIVGTLEQPGYPIQRLALGPDGRALAASGIDDRVWVWDVDRTADLRMVQIGKHPQGLAFSPDGKTLAVLDQGSRITLWDVPR